MRDENKKVLAERIAAILQSEPGVEGSEQLWKAVGELGRRLEAVERSIGQAPGPAPRGNSSVSHPSLEKYAVLEAVSHIGQEEKACGFEPNGKPCDHCSMCSSRGF